VHFDDLSLQESADKISELAASNTFSYVVTPNIDPFIKRPHYRYVIAVL